MRTVVVSSYIFYCNATKETGLGHLSRCLNLAREIALISGYQSIRFFGNYDAFAYSKIKYYAFDFLPVMGPEAKCSTIICDDYSFLKNDLLELHLQGHKLCIIDDFQQYDFDFVDLIINFRFNAELFYQTQRQHCLGINFFSFSPDLKAIREEKTPIQNPKKVINTILVFIGGSDTFNVGVKVIAALDLIFTDKTFILLDKTEPRINVKNNDLQVIGFTENIAQLFRSVDIIVNGGGLTKYEAGFCLIPNCAISQTSEQHLDTLELSKHNLTYDLGLAEQANVEHLASELQKFLKIIPEQLSSFAKVYNTNSTRNLALEIIKA